MYILNIILPVWIVFMFTWFLVPIIIFGNFIIDFAIYRIYAYIVKSSTIKQWKFILMAYLLGFAADLIGGLLLIGIYMFEPLNVGYIHIYDTWYSILIHLFIVAFTAYLIYVFNKSNLKDSGLEKIRQHRLALIMAIATAPYTFLIPAILFS